MSGPTVSFVLLARWRAKPGRAGQVAAILRALAAASREEEGCLFYLPCSENEDEDAFFVMEIYRNERAFEEHVASEHFRRYVEGEAQEHLAERVRTFATGLLDVPYPDARSTSAEAAEEA